MPIPSSELPGHQQVREWTQAALERLQELPSVDFKQSEPWEVLRWRITRTTLGMGNLRGGGLIIVGVKEEGTEWKATGLEAEHLATFDPDNLKDQIDRHVSPSAELDIVLHAHSDGNSYLAIRVSEFDLSPLVCRKSGGPGGRPIEVEEGRIYVRPSKGHPRTTRIKTAEDMEDLLELAAEKRARRMLALDRRIRGGHQTSPTDQELFEQELGGL